eukprot:TRINITY_DN53884_c0_g1_i1.p1 TRINITY_DN53884_c0_g1~~TRINITY_DN53884_c0_g1_i1.p1  ORF type:complete len:455 (+),score=54.91 TRINITY_DN53884_c0_g1_i1:120-1367(+)
MPRRDTTSYDFSNIFRKVTPEAEDCLSRMAKSRIGILRAVGRSRKSVLANRLMMAIPVHHQIMIWLIPFFALGPYYTILALAVDKDLEQDWNFLTVSFSLLGLCLVSCLCLTLRNRAMIHTPEPSLELAEGQTVSRGCLLEGQPSGENLDPGSSVGVCSLLSNNIALGDFELRQIVYQVRAAVHVLVLVLTALGKALKQADAIPENSLLQLLLSLQVMIGAVTLDSAVSCVLGNKWTVAYVLGKRCRKKNKRFMPCDPRAFILQNMVFLSAMAPGSAVFLYLSLFEDLSSSSHAVWLLPASSSLMMLLATQVYIPYSFCPGTFVVGMLVESGLLAPPCQNDKCTTRLLTYGQFGPVVEIPNHKAVEDSKRCCACPGLWRQRVTPAPLQEDAQCQDRVIGAGPACHPNQATEAPDA